MSAPYYRLSLIVSIVLLILDLVVYKHPFTIISIALIGLVLSIGATFRVGHSMGWASVPVKTAIICLTVPVNLVAAGLLVLTVANYPPTAPFDGKTDLYGATPQDALGYSKLSRLLSSTTGCFITPERTGGSLEYLLPPGATQSVIVCLILLRRQRRRCPCGKRENIIIMLFTCQSWGRYSRLNCFSSTISLLNPTPAKRKKRICACGTSLTQSFTRKMT
jgi:hypothetical protein